MSRETDALLELTIELARSRSLEDMLQRLVARAAAALDVHRVSVRMLDATGKQLLVGARTGDALHSEQISFTPGEGLIGWVAANAAPLRIADAEEDARFVERPSRREGLGSFLAVPLMEGTSCMGVLSAMHGTHDYFSEQHESELALMAALCAPHLSIARLRRLAEVDPLTGALNRRGLDACFPEVELPEGPEPALSVVLLDLDHFKLVNDEYGHEVGDEALRALSRALGGISRKGDAVVRLGGDEFLLVLVGATSSAAARVADRARDLVASHRIVCAKGVAQFTVSAGVAERCPGESREDLLKRADQAMYQAKQLGRNRVQVALAAPHAPVGVS